MKPAKAVSPSLPTDPFAFRWVRDADGYVLQHPARRSGQGETSWLLENSGPQIAAAGGSLVEYPPRAISDLHRQFAAIGDDPADVLAFVQAYGYLGLDLRSERGDSRHETVAEILAARDRIRDALDVFDNLKRLELRAVQRGREMREEGKTVDAKAARSFRTVAADLFNQWAAPRLSVRLAAAEGAGGAELAIALEPQTLLASMWLQVAEELTGAARHSSCTWCRKPMFGRAGRLTCSDACRQAKSTHNRAQKAANAAPSKGEK